jgi:hypothetical protein
MFANLSRNRSRAELVLVALLAFTLAAFTAQLFAGPSPRAPHQDQRASVELSVPARG